MLPAATLAQPRARGAVILSAKRLGRRSALDDLRQSGAMKALFPAPRSGAVQTVLINTAGGITGGDIFTVSATAGEDAALSITTQAAERVYQSQPGEMARVTNRLAVRKGARIHWLPQETILFEKCALRRKMHVDLDAGASLLLAEPLVFGRAAMGETLRHVRFDDRIDIRRAGRPLFLDAMTLQGDVTGHLALPHIAANAGAMALIVYVAADAGARLGPLRALLPQTGGASLIGDDMIVARILAEDSFELRKSLVPALVHLSYNDLPRSWMT